MTNINQWVEKFLEKWPIKLICFVVAIFLYIFHQASLIDKKTFVVPLQVSENGEMIHIGDLPASVAVVIKASPDEINIVHNNDITALINLDSYTATGNYKVPIELKLKDNVLALDPFEIRPKQEYINVQLDKKIQKYLKVVPSLVGEVAYGYTVSNVSVDPSYVLVTGPEQQIKGIAEISTAKVNISNAMTNFSSESAFLRSNKHVALVENENCKVTISVVPQAMTKDINNIVINPHNLSENLQIDNILPKVDISITGEVNVVEKFTDVSDLARVDLLNYTEPGEYEVDVEYYHPNNIAVLRKSIEKVTVILGERTLMPEEIVPQDLENVEIKEGVE